MTKIFVSYRRDDSQWQTKAIYEALSRHVTNPREDIFYDLDSMTVGLNFKQQIERTVEKTDIMLAMIGNGWLNAVDPDTGLRRLDDPRDFVRAEIAAALQRDIPVIPVLLDGVSVPNAQELPEDIRELAMRHGVKVRADSFDSDVRILIRGLKLEESQHPQPILSPAGPAQPSKPELIAATRKSWFDASNYLFISYPKDIDPAFMREIIRRLLAQRISIWLYQPESFGLNEEDLAGIRWARFGENFSRTTLDALSNSKCVLALIGRDSANIEFQSEELQQAVGHSRVVSAIVDDLPFDQLPFGFASLHTPHLLAARPEVFQGIGSPSDAQLQLMVREIKEHLSELNPKSALAPTKEASTRHSIGLASGLLVAIILAALGIALVDPFGWFYRQHALDLAEQTSAEKGGNEFGLRPGASVLELLVWMNDPANVSRRAEAEVAVEAHEAALRKLQEAFVAKGFPFAEGKGFGGAITLKLVEEFRRMSGYQAEVDLLAFDPGSVLALAEAVENWTPPKDWSERYPAPEAESSHNPPDLKVAGREFPPMCSDDRDTDLKGNSKLKTAANGIFPITAPRSSAPNCQSPLHLVEHDGFDYLLANRNEGDCHACPAILSLYKSKKGAPESYAIEVYDDFARAGARGGLVGEIHDIEVNGNPWIIIEDGYGNQGVFGSWLVFLSLGPGVPKEVPAEPTICTSYSDENSGYSEPQKTSSLDTNWEFDQPTKSIHVSYKKSDQGVQSSGTADWRFDGQALRLQQDTNPLLTTDNYVCGG